MDVEGKLAKREAELANFEERCTILRGAIAQLKELIREKETATAAAYAAAFELGRNGDERNDSASADTEADTKL